MPSPTTHRQIERPGALPTLPGRDPKMLCSASDQLAAKIRPQSLAVNASKQIRFPKNSSANPGRLVEPWGSARWFPPQEASLAPRLPALKTGNAPARGNAGYWLCPLATFGSLTREDTDEYSAARESVPLRLIGGRAGSPSGGASLEESGGDDSSERILAFDEDQQKATTSKASSEAAGRYDDDPGRTW